MRDDGSDIPEELDPDSLLTVAFSGIETENKRYRLALEGLATGVFEYYASIDHFEANEIWFHHTGLMRGDGIEAFLSRVPENDRAEIGKLLAGGDTGTRITKTTSWHNPPDPVKWISISGVSTTLCGRPSETLHFAGTLIDITALRQIQDNFIESEILQATAFRELPLGLVFIDAKSRKIEQINQYGADLFGMTIGEITGKDCFRTICHAEPDCCPVCDLAQEIKEQEKEILRPDGSTRWVLKTVSKIPMGNEMKLLESYFDITRQKKTEAELISRTDQLGLATRAGRVGIWNYNIEKETEEWDDQMYRLYQATREEFPGGEKAWAKRIHPDDVAMQKSEVMKAVAGEKDYDSEFRIVWPDRSIHNIRAMSMLKKDQDGKPTNLVGTNWDITGQKETENELIRTNLHLEAAGIRANRLMIEAESANVAKSAFLATISHEIRTPLNGVIGMANLLIDTALSDEQRQYARLLKESGDTLLSLINDVLDFSKMEARKLEICKKEFNPRETIDSTVTMMNIHAAEKDLTLSATIDKDVPETVIGDENRLRQILVNLIGNALKFTDKGSVSVHASIADSSNDVVTIRFSIVDTGIGIAPEKQKLLFTPFSQLDTSTTRRFGGTGLGLAISKQLVLLMRGDIGVISDGKHGTTFWFTVRFDGAGKASGTLNHPAQTKVPPKQSASPRPAPRRNLRILLAEDNATNRLIAVKLLEKLGYAPDVVETGEEAVAAFVKKEYDIIFMDCQMPVMDGYEATKAIRALPGRAAGSEKKEVPIIAMTAHALSGDREKCIEAGMDDYLVKPVIPEALAAAIERWSPDAQHHDVPVMPSRAIFDRDSFYTRLSNDEELARVVIAAFLEDIPTQLAALDKSVAADDLKEAEHFAHRIRGASVNLGCHVLCDRAIACELAASESAKETLKSSVRLLHEAYREAAAILETFV
jgi:PAS domain S-box-containing protein